ncbi:T9SS type A sorting domain-containing protein [bacterium BMS3Abin03]|nr:T9SS type A sorting domain-containing protein [bacterium BMS3Abin03]
MKYSFIQLLWGFILILVPFTAVLSQQDPLHWTHPIKVEANDIYLQWLQNDNGTVHSYQKIYNLKIDSLYLLPPDSLVSVKPGHQDNRTGAGAFTDAASGNFTVSVYDEIVSIWKSPTGINIMLPNLDTTEALWTNSIQDSITGNIENARIYVRTLDIDGDSLDEFVVAYISSDDSVHLNLYDADSTLHPTLISSYSDEKLVAAYGFQFTRYFIETGDFNGDGKDEMALFAVQVPPPTGSVRVRVKIYGFSGGTFQLKIARNIDVPRLTTLEDFTMSASSGHFTSDNIDEIAFTTIRSSEGAYYSYNYILKSNQNLDALTLGPRYRVTPPIFSGFADLSMTSGDLNGDGRDEIAFTDNSNIYVLEPDDNLNLILTSTKGVASGGFNDYQQSNNYLKIERFDQDTTNDLVIVKNFVANQYQNGFLVAIYSVNNSLDNLSLIGRLLGDEPEIDDYKPYSIAVGNFDGFNFTIGQPFHYTQNNVVQTLVKLNAPPIHFDVFDGQSYDINNCYNGGICGAYSKYIKTDLSATEVTTSVHRDWEVSAGAHISGQVEVAPFGVGATIDYNAYFLHKWGRHFSKDSTNIKTWKISEEITSSEDDKIYSTVSDYDLWEYPFYYGNEDFPRATIMTLVPHNVTGHWFPSKSYYALSYNPNHEVGNILSYYDTLANNSNVSEPLGATYGTDSYTLSSSTGDDKWDLTFEDFTSVQADTAIENTNSWGVSFVVEATGNFGHTNYSTHKTSVLQTIHLQTHFGSVDLGIGDVKYTVKPYAYWSSDGTLVVDYAVKPEVAPPGFTKTWWQNHYEQNSDPTFILPWLLDPEKGFTLDDPDKRYQTNDILLNPANPSPGDTVTITAKIRNFSLIATPSPVSVSFYINDPDSGGTPIIGTNGTNTVSTNGVVPSRVESDVQLKWVLPSGLPQYPRIYAVLDEGNSITEIHENNNKGFNVLGIQTISGIEDANYTAPINYVLYQSYPNPFNPTTNIKYSIPKSSKVSLKIYDILGREVTSLVDKYEKSGTYTIQFTAKNLASGIYFYRIKAGKFVQTKKLMLLK